MENEELVKRTRTVIEKQLNDYYIFEIDKNARRLCRPASLSRIQEGAENLPAFMLSPSHENEGIGQKLIQFVEAKARRNLAWAELLTLSTQAFTYFQSMGGFTDGTPDDLPPQRRDKYDQSGRNSKVLVKKLAKGAVITQNLSIMECGWQPRKRSGDSAFGLLDSRSSP